MKKTVKIAALVIAMAMIFATLPMTAFAASSSTGLEFTSNGDGTCYVSGIGDCTDTDIIIPSQSPEDDTVTGIGDWAFYYCTDLTSITIPDSVTNIGYEAFKDCYGLTSITIPAGVTTIGDHALDGCRGLTSITVDESNTVYHSASNCLIETASKALLAGCKNSVIPTDGSVTSISDYAFAGCRDLTSINIPDSITSIGMGAFSYCRNLASINIPDDVTNIGVCAFEDCYNLSTIYFEGSEEEWDNITKGAGWNNQTGAFTENGTYTIMFNSTPDSPAPEKKNNLAFTSNGDGTCYVSGIGECSKDAEVIIPSTSPAGDTVIAIGDRAFFACSKLVNIEIASTVTEIGELAFLGCELLKTVTLANNSQLKVIGPGAFNGCNNLKSIELSKNITELKPSAFANCGNLETIYFEGSEEDWNKVTKGQQWNKDTGKDTDSGIFNIVFNAIIDTPDTSKPGSNASNPEDNEDDWDEDEDDWDDGKVTNKPKDEEPEEENKDGCASSVAVTALALVAALGTCTAFVTKKKRGLI